MHLAKYLKWQYLLLPLIIYVSDDTVLFGTNSNQFFIYIKYAVLIFLSMKLMIGNSNIFRSKAFIVCILLCLLAFLSSYFNSDLRLGLVYKSVILLLSCAYATTTDIRTFANLYVNFIYIIASISLVCTLLLFLAPGIFSFAPQIDNSADVPFYNLFVYVTPSVVERVRNYGVFREPGVFQMYLIIALVLSLYFSKEFEVKQFAVMVAALILTFSTTGYVALAAVIALFVLNNNSAVSQKNKKYIYALIIIGFGLIATKTNLLSSDGIIFDKIQDTNRHTTIARMSSITSNIEIWKQNPFFGAGLQKVNDQFPILSLYEYGYASEHNTNTFLCELATFGIFYFMLFICGTLMFSRLFGRSKLEHLLILLILVILAVGEKLTFSPFFYIMVFYGYNYNEIKKYIYET